MRISDDKRNKINPDEIENSLGISRATYALGHSTKDFFLWGSVVAAISGVAIYFGRKQGNLIDTTANVLGDFHEKCKKLIGKERSSKLGSAIGISVILGGLVGHVLQIPSAHSGWKKATSAIRKYDAVVSERNRLIDVNAALARNIQSLAKSAANEREEGGSLAERVRARREETADLMSRS